MPKFQTQQETWDGNTVNPGTWINGFNTGQVAISGGQMVITLTAGLTNYCGYDSSPNATLVDSSFSSRLVSAGNQSLASLEAYPIQLIKDTNNYVSFMISGNVVAAVKKIAGTRSNVATVTYDSVAMQYYRIREENGTVYWDYGPDGVKWTNLASIAVSNLFAITSLYMEPTAGTWQIEASTSTVIMDNFNYIPSNKPGNLLANVKVGNGMGKAG